MDVLFSANAVAQEVVAAVVQRHRAAGVLTWALLHDAIRTSLQET
jgi:hypothetical protein